MTRDFHRELPATNNKNSRFI
ncbi:hypothetical protein YPPY54_3054, partial [Yersinia pestis PY-54]